MISNGLQSVACSGKSKSLCAYEVCREALELYSQESGIGKFFYIMNSRLRMVRSIQNPTRDCFAIAVTESCGDLADFVRLMWEGLNFEFPGIPRREVVVFRGVELSEAALESYREIVGGLFAWPMFSSFTDKRAEAEEYGRAWRGGIQVLFVLRSSWCRRLRNGTYLLHPFAVLQVEAVTGNVVRLVEVEGLASAPVTPLPAQRPRVIAGEHGRTELHFASRDCDVRAIARFASRPEFLNVGDFGGWTPLHAAAGFGQIEVVKALVWFGADVNRSTNDGATPVCIAAQEGNASIVLVLASLGANVNAAINDGWTPLMIASSCGKIAVVVELLKAGASLEARLPDGATAMVVARANGQAAVVALLENARAGLKLE
jgi:hypothetical protein